MKRSLIAAFVAALALGGIASAYDFRKLVVLKLHAESISVGESETETTVGQIAGLSSVSSADVTVTDDLTVTDDVTADDIKANSIRGEAPTTQVIAAGGTIAADACGGVKRISSATAVTTDTTNTFTAPAAGNEGCVMTVCNENASDAVTLDANANFQSAAAGNVALGALDCVIVASSGASGKWYQAAAAVNN